MFGWFKPRCPVDLREKVWIELSLERLVEAFGWDRLRDTTVVLPTWEFFDPPRGRAPSVIAAALQRICAYLGTDPADYRLEVVDGDPRGAPTADPQEPAGVSRLRVPAEAAEDLESLVAELALRICRELVLRQEIVDGEDEQLDWFAGLASVYFGLGVFGANAAVKQRSYSDGIRHGWTVQRVGRMPARMFGYALALFALARGESRPAWANLLGCDGRDAFARGTRYLTRTGETVFDLQRNGAPRPPQSDAALLADVARGTDSQRLAALWTLQNRQLRSLDWVPPVLACIRSQNPVLRVEAMRVLGFQAGPPPGEAIDELMLQLASSEAETRQTAALVVGRLQVPLDRETPGGHCLGEELQLLLDDPSRAVVQAAAIALSRHGVQAAPLAPLLIRPLCKALVDCDTESTWLYFHVLAAITPDLEQFLARQMPESHPDLVPAARHELEWFLVERQRQ